MKPFSREFWVKKSNDLDIFMIRDQHSPQRSYIHLRGTKLEITFDFIAQIPSNIQVFQNTEVLQLNP